MSPLNLQALRAEFPHRTIHYYATIDSTMRVAAECPINTVILAGEQTAGQGRHGHAWHSEKHSGLYLSIVLDPAPVLTLALGLATQNAILEATGITCDLRWPNDVMLEGKKVAGILVQLVNEKAIAGIGINVNQQTFPPELSTIATSLKIQTGKNAPTTSLAVALLHAVDNFVKEDADAILRLFTHASSYAAGRRVTVDHPDGIIEGTTAGLTPSGFLIVRKDDGTDTLILAGGVRASSS